MTPFTEFSFNGHSCNDYHLIRVSDGSRYNETIMPTISDKTVELSRNDGTMLFNTYHKQKQFSINVAFDSLIEQDIRNIRQWLKCDATGDLIFGEDEERVYQVKVSSAPSFKYICFEKNGERVYKGEGTIQFICYTPYAHSKQKYTLNSGAAAVEIGGTVATTLIVKYDGTESETETNTLTVKYTENDIPITKTITLKAAAAKIEWNTSTGLVVAIVDNNRVPQRVVGDTRFSLSPGVILNKPDNGTIEYYHWYA